MKSASEIWEDILRIIKTKINELTYNTWFSPIIPLEIKNNTLYLRVPVPLHKDFITQKFLTELKEYAYMITDDSFDIVLLTEEEKIPFQKEDTVKDTNLNPKYTFESFVVGKSNQFANAACIAVADMPGKAYNPLFLYGGVGLGKTHLMHAIGHHIFSQDNNKKIVYTTGEVFTNELINSIKDDKNKEFRSKYRSMDVLLIDDIQFIAGKESTQEEFFHTFNTLYQSNKQIVMTSDRPPKEINLLEERLRSRFESGLIGDVQPPDLETRIAILRKKAQTKNHYIPDAVLTHVANIIKSNIRELEGAINKIALFSSLSNNPITEELADEALKEYATGQHKTITATLIQEEVSKYYNIDRKDLISTRKTKELAHPRQIAMYICRELTDLSLPVIGNEFGGRDHTTVMYSVQRVENKIKSDYRLSSNIKDIINNIKN